MVISLSTKVGKRFSYEITPSSCYKYKVIRGELPSGLSLESGFVSGRVKRAGVYFFSIRAKSHDSCQVFSFRLKVMGVRKKTAPQAKWVAVGEAGTDTIKYSLNGVNWRKAESGTFNGNGKGVASNGKMWIAVGEDYPRNNTIKTSINGIDWNNADTGMFEEYGFGIAWGGSSGGSGMWVAVGEGDGAGETGTIKYSLDGLHWNNSTGSLFASGYGYGIAASGNSMWVAVGSRQEEEEEDGDTIKYSFDGITWDDSQTGLFSSSGYGVAWNGKKWVAVGSDSDGGGGGTIKYSLDGLIWENATTGLFGGVGHGIAASGDSMWVAVGDDLYGGGGTTIKYSTDGIAWIDATGSLFKLSGYGVAWNGELWVSVGYDSPGSSTIKTSLDGINWVPATGSLFGSIGYGVASSVPLTSY